MPEVKDKNGEPIHVGDHVFARARGGSHEGDVEKIVTTKEEAEREGVKHPPKVSCFSPGPQARMTRETFCSALAH